MMKTWNWNNIAIILIALFFLVTCATRKRIGAICEDGWESTATGSGACAWHDGVEYWKVQYWWGEESTVSATGYFEYFLNIGLLVFIVWQFIRIRQGKD